MNLGRTNVKFLAVFFALAFVIFYTLSTKHENKMESRKLSGIDFEAFSSKSDTKNVFLVETGKEIDNVKFTPRLACSIESAARANVGRKVILLYAFQESFQELQYSPLIDAVLSYPNVFFDSTDVTELSIGSPMEEFVKSEKLAASQYPIEHLTSVLRLLVLWKHGGVYIDGDVIVRRSFDTVPSNFVCRQDDEFSIGVLGFDHENNGKELIETLMKEFTEKYNPDIASANDSPLVTQVIKQICSNSDIEEIMKMKSCKGFNFLEVQECYAVGYAEWEKFVSHEIADSIEVMNRVSESLVVHIWNHFSRHYIIETDSVAPYLELARQFCPKVLQASGDYF